MEYFAFGETFVEDHKNSINSPFKFNGKELDEESGLYYYGARYDDPKLSIWASVDPLMEQGPEFSPYCYTFNNPVKFIDPDGNWPDFPASFKNAFRGAINGIKQQYNAAKASINHSYNQAKLQLQEQKIMLVNQLKMLIKVLDNILKNTKKIYWRVRR